MTKTCRNCKHRCFASWSGIEYCLPYEMTETEAEEIETAESCDRYETGTPDCLNKDYDCPSASAGDYSPSSPWNAPGMSIRDFV